MHFALTLLSVISVSCSPDQVSEFSRGDCRQQPLYLPIFSATDEWEAIISQQRFRVMNSPRVLSALTTDVHSRKPVFNPYLFLGIVCVPSLFITNFSDQGVA